MSQKLTAREVLERTYQLLLKKHLAKTIKLKERVSTEEQVSWDSCKGADYEIWDYDSFAVLDFGKSKWGLALGEFSEKRSLYPTNSRNILAFQLKGKNVRDVFPKIDRYNSHRLAIATTDGRLFFDESFLIQSLLFGFKLALEKLIKACLLSNIKMTSDFIKIEKLEIKLRKEGGAEERLGKVIMYPEDTAESVANFVEAILQMGEVSEAGL